VPREYSRKKINKKNKKEEEEEEGDITAQHTGHVTRNNGIRLRTSCFPCHHMSTNFVLVHGATKQMYFCPVLRRL
jgi:hypothetical protein